MISHRSIFFWIVRSALLSAGLFNSGTAAAQLDNRAFFLDESTPHDEKGELSLRTYMLGFLRNNEYFHPNEPGRTWFGFQFQPEAAYQLDQRTTVFGGLYYRQDFGNPEPRTIRPVWRVRMAFDSLTLTLGNLYGSLQRDLPLPVYSFENVLEQRIEEGVQLNYRNRGIRAEAWADWRNMIYDGSNEPEEIWGGGRLAYRKDRKNYWAEIGGLLTAYHEGGQIDSSDAPLLIYMNAGLNVTFGVKLQNKKLNEIYGGYHLLRWDDLSPGDSTEETSVHDGGPAHLAFIGAKTKRGEIQLNYYRAWYFQAPFASDVYTSAPLGGAPVPEDFPGVQLLFLRYLRDIKVSEETTLTLRFEPFYDFTRNLWEFNMGLYVNIEDWHRLAKIY